MGLTDLLQAAGGNSRRAFASASLVPISRRILKTLTIVIAATIVIALLTDLFHVSGGPSLYMAAVISVAALFGVPYGLLASMLAVLLLHTAFESGAIIFDPPTHQDFINALVFVAGALVSGVYADALRRRQAAMRLLLEAGRSGGVAAPSEGAVERALGQLGVEPRFRLADELRDTSVAILMVLCGTITAAGLHFVLGIRPGSGIFVAAVIIAAITRGPRAALVAGIVAVLAANMFLRGDPSLRLGAVQDFVNLFMFTAVAWWVGHYASNVRHQREIARTMFAASQGLSTVASEESLRAELRASLCRLCRSSSVWVIDQFGTPDHGSADHLPIVLAEVEPELRADSTYAVGPWRARRLRAEGADLGCVIWLTGAVNTEDAGEINEAIPILISLGASAIVRARLSAQKAQTELLAQTERLRTALLSSISHDFRTPLAGILGSATSLLELGEKHSEERKRDLLVNIKTQAARLNRYVENLLSITRLESGILAIERRPVLLEPLVYDAWEALGDMGGALRVLNTQIPPNATVLADPMLLFNALVNLSENAIKYSEIGSTVSVKAAQAGGRFQIEITDCGPGVNPDELPRIFDRFYRAGSNTAHGMGLGLYITKQLLEAMGAAVGAHARTDGRSGLTIRFTLQAAEEEKP
ncbi:MAG: PAS domain-containing sensor histidine kinase [Alphaproteobacteria bacterium]|nr:PAS domain-containing sensor histidine kinase [Alphaproteobacteria bacterium]